MDGHSGKRKFLRRLAVLVAIAGPVPAFADYPSTTIQAKLASGFGAGTHQGLVQHVPVVMTPPASCSNVAANSTRSNTQQRSIVTEAPVLFEAANGLAALATGPATLGDFLRSSNKLDDRTCQSEVSPVMLDSPGEQLHPAVQIEMTPTVPKILLGARVKDRSTRQDSGAVVQLAERVDVTLVPKPRVVPIVVPRVDHLGSPAMPGSELPSARRVRAMPEAPTSLKPAPASQIRALADSELSEIDEVPSNDPTAAAATTEATVRWNSFSYQRNDSRRQPSSDIPASPTNRR
jgi:hypothetical protein